MHGLTRRALLLFGLVASAWSAAFAATAVGPGITLADFEAGVPAGLEATTAAVSVVDSPDIAGGNCLRVLPKGKSHTMGFRLAVPDKLDLSRFRALTFRVRVPRGEVSVPLRWHALDGRGHPILQRRQTIETFGEWVAIEEPLALWRWAGERVPRWTEVRSVAFTIEAPVKELYIDDIRLAVGDHPLAAYPTTEWLLAVAFVGRRHRSVASDGFLVATDALGPLSDDDLRQHTRQMARVRAWLVRLFAEAMRPADKRPPVSLLIFADATDYRAFFTRLGDVWRVYIPLPTSNAYTVQDITGSTYSSHYGIRRPVYLHEAVHAIATRQLHVRTGVDRHTWLHEGLANYLQVAVFPSSVEWRIYTRNFARPIAPDGSTFFKPVGVLLRRHVKPEHYVQLAGLMAYLVEKRPAWLPPLARGLAEGKRVDQILTDLGTTPRALQAEWLAWGKERFPPDAEPKPFPSPQEWTGIKPPAP